MVTLRDAATVMLVRDREEGMEVFMLRRHLRSEFGAGAFVFPGGAVDEADRYTDLEAVCDGRSDAEASELLGIERGGLAFWVAAIRECFEEAGVLLAYEPDGRGGKRYVSLSERERAARFAGHRAAVHAGERRLVEICEQEGLRLAADAIHYFSHWITPEGMPRRFDTRFFVAAAPDEQDAVHDDLETVAHAWIRPADALARNDRGEFDLVLPTIKNLQTIARLGTSGELLAAAAAAAAVPAVQPRISADRHAVRILLPDDPGYDDAVGGTLPADVSLTDLSREASS